MTAIRNEPPGDYYIGRRYFKRDYKFWGYVRRPGQPWRTAQLVMMDENTKLAPDRAANQLGSDNNTEYKLIGEFSGETVYEPASNGFYPEFVLQRYELRSVAPANIFRAPGATDPSLVALSRNPTESYWRACRLPARWCDRRPLPHCWADAWCGRRRRPDPVAWCDRHRWRRRRSAGSPE